MKLRRAKYYRDIVKSVTPQLKLVMSMVSMAIADSTVKGYTTTSVCLPEIIKTYDLNIDETKESTLRNLIIKELEKKGFAFKCEPGQVLKIFW